MNWRLIFGLSIFGLAMAIGTVFVIPSNIEPICWLVIFLICAYVIGRERSMGHFMHGLFVGVINSVWVTAVHILFFERYLESHPKEAGMMNSMPLPTSPRLMMALVGPVIGVISGTIIGLLAYGASKFVAPRVPMPQQ